MFILGKSREISTILFNPKKLNNRHAKHFPGLTHSEFHLVTLFLLQLINLDSFYNWCIQGSHSAKNQKKVKDIEISMKKQKIAKKNSRFGKKKQSFWQKNW